MGLEIRKEQPNDIPSIRYVNRLAFGQDNEADIVDALRSNGGVLLSLVAETEQQIVGHILYTPITIDNRITGAALGPMSVLPEHQSKGIGSRLVEEGNVQIKQMGWPFIIVLGHSNFYPRFGFKPAGTYRIRCEWEVPDEVFMILVFDESRMEAVSGLAKYRHEFTTP